MLTAGAFICGSIFLLLTGCVHQPPPPPAYAGPTEPIEEVVDQINANNSRLPTLWAHIGGASMEIDYVDDKGKRQSQVLGGTLLYRAPGEVKLVGHHDLAGDVMVIGSNANVYWLRVGDENSGQVWWGRYKYLGADCVQPIPIRPDLLLSVLGVSTINVDLLQEPVPVMRFNNKADAYMLIWNTHLPNSNHWVAVKEVWYDRATKRPKLVVLFDVNGRVLLEAHLSQHAPVQVPDLSREKWPTVATAYDVTMPETKGRMRLKLSDLALTQKGAPNDVTFRFNPQSAGVPKVTQLDEACGP
ncbi:MAG TPA: hypothetical protein VGF52_00240 [Tepidisphaeraceae bacterium]